MESAWTSAFGGYLPSVDRLGKAGVRPEEAFVALTIGLRPASYVETYGGFGSTPVLPEVTLVGILSGLKRRSLLVVRINQAISFHSSLGGRRFDPRSAVQSTNPGPLASGF